MRRVKLWVDDERFPPMDYVVWCNNSKDAIRFLDNHWGQIEEISLDHDLGSEDYGTGYDVINFIEEKVRVFSFELSFKIKTHSMNGPGRQNIQRAINSINRYAESIQV